jgi:hypothetical protein
MKQYNVNVFGTALQTNALYIEGSPDCRSISISMPEDGPALLRAVGCCRSFPPVLLAAQVSASARLRRQQGTTQHTRGGADTVVLMQPVVVRKIQYQFNFFDNMETKKLLPRGLRNNNPLNLRRAEGVKWQGQRMEQTDPAFVQFDSPAWGLRAAFKVLARYIDDYHLRTVAAIIGRWAPPSENDTAAYARSVLLYGRLGGNEVICSASADQMKRLVAAMARVENGQAPAPQQVDEGWSLYLQQGEAPGAAQ